MSFVEHNNYIANERDPLGVMFRKQWHHLFLSFYMIVTDNNKKVWKDHQAI